MCICDHAAYNVFGSKSLTNLTKFKCWNSQRASQITVFPNGILRNRYVEKAHKGQGIEKAIIIPKYWKCYVDDSFSIT